METPPNEKLIEIMFNGALLRQYGASIGIYAPTTREEYKAGYDAKVTLDGCSRELFLQFKSVQFIKSDKRSQSSGYSFDITTYQHKILQQRPQRTAYYVAATFREYDDVRKAQKDAQEDALAFLRYYVAIDVSILPADVKTIRFSREFHQKHGREKLPKEVRYKAGDGWKSLNIDQWLRADEVIEDFTKDTLGGEISCLREAIIAADNALSVAEEKALLKSGKGDEATVNGISLRWYGV